MNLDELLTHVTVLGAAGKMGRGIALLLLQEMARLEASKTGKVGSGTYRLTLIDNDEQALMTVRPYLRPLIRKYAEKNINVLRSYYKDNKELVSNEEIIDAFVEGSLDILRPASHLEASYESRLIFEAILEDVELKGRVLSNIAKNNRQEHYILTNTSSIPIHVINEKAELQGHVIGFHFYNPPPIQKLLEIIPLEKGDAALTAISGELAKRLGKTAVMSKDVPGFIGNGHFLREITYVFNQAKDLGLKEPAHKVITLLNYVTQEFLIRPMGIFQLIDYVGIDVASRIGKIMSEYLSDPIDTSFVNEYLSQGIKGGQNPDGSQKDGFFKYVKGVPVEVYSIRDKKYIPIDPQWTEYLGPLPSGHFPWKVLMKDPKKNEKLKSYFEKLFNQDTPGAALAKSLLTNSRDIALNLVETGVAKSLDDVNTVLTDGFYHLYGPTGDVLPFFGLTGSRS